MNNEKVILRQPIVTVCGHVDHGKTSLLDRLRGTSVQEREAGGITQKISFTKYPLEQVKKVCPLVCREGINLEIPGFLFIDTPGHAAFTNLRKRGGSLADLAIVVVSIREGIKPQTVEVFQILKSTKTPFLIALNKIDSLSGWKQFDNIKESIEKQAENVKNEFLELLLNFQGELKEQGFNSALFYEVADFTKEVAIVPCSAKTGEGIKELIFVLCGLCQKFLKEQLKKSTQSKGIILEMKKEKGIEFFEAILYDGILKENDQIIIAGLDGAIMTKVRAIEEVLPLSDKFKAVREVSAATGVRIQLKDKEGIIAGMPFQKAEGNVEKIKEDLQKEISFIFKLDKKGIIIKADSLGSLEALIYLLKQEQIPILKAGIGPIGKSDIMLAKANLEIDELDAIILGFNVDIEGELETKKIKIITNNVIYKLIEDLQKYRKEKALEIEKNKLMGMATLCKLEILHSYVFRNSNPAIFGVKVVGGKVRIGLPLIDEQGEKVSYVKSLQKDKDSLNEAVSGNELAIALPGVAFDRRLKNIKYLYSDLSEEHIKSIKENRELLSSEELSIFAEIIKIKESKSV